MILETCRLLSPPPADIRKIETTALHRILHLATNALTRSAILNLSSMGGPRLQSVGCTALAAMFRTATKTLPQWQDWMRQLKIVSSEHLSLVEVAQGHLSPAFWDAPPFAAAFAETMNELQQLTRTREPCSALLRDIAVQRFAYSCLFPRLYSSDLLSVLGRRLKSIFSSELPDIHEDIIIGLLETATPLVTCLHADTDMHNRPLRQCR